MNGKIIIAVILVTFFINVQNISCVKADNSGSHVVSSTAGDGGKTEDSGENKYAVIINIVVLMVILMVINIFMARKTKQRENMLGSAVSPLFKNSGHKRRDNPHNNRLRRR